MPSKSPLRCTLAGLLVFASLAGAAAVADPAAETDLETVTVYARRITPVTRVAATVTVVDQARIDTVLAADIRELVRYEPGISVRNDPFRFGLDTVSIRGLGGNRVAVEIDGIPAAGGFAVGSYADSGRAFVDPAFVERVEFLRGPASSLYGSDAIGGIVAMTTLSPGTLLAGQTAMTVRTQAGYDTADNGWNAAALAAGKAGPGSWMLGYSRREGRETDSAADVAPNPRDYTSDSVLLKYEATGVPGGPLMLTLEAGRVAQDSSIDAFLGLPGRFANTTALTAEDEMLRYRASLQHSLRQGARWFDSADWRLYWQGTETDQDTLEIRQAAPPRSPPVRLDRSFNYDESTFGAEFTAVRARTGTTVMHDVVYGIEATRTRLEELRDGLQTNLLTGATTATILGESFPLRDLPLTDVTEVGLFVQDEIRALGNSSWSVIPALRVDYYRLSPRMDGTFRADNPNSKPVGLDEVSLAPKIGAIYRLSDSLGVFFQYAHGFRSPPPEDVNIGLEIPLFNVRAIPNPDLRPETSDGFETGLRFDDDGLSLTTSVFLTKYEDFIESKVNLGADPVTGVTLFQSQNVAEAHIYGAELTATAQVGEWSPVLAGWSARLVAAWMRGEDLERHEPLNSIDPPRLVLAARYDAPSARWGSELALTGVEAQRNVDRSRANLYRTDGYATLDLLANVQVAPGLRLNLGLFNLTDTEYIEWADVRGRTVDDPLVPYYTQAGFNAAVSLHYGF